MLHHFNYPFLHFGIPVHRTIKTPDAGSGAKPLLCSKAAGHLPRNVLAFLCCFLLLTGCSYSEAPEKTKDLDFTVVSGTDIPEELQGLIQERQENSFELTFSDNACLYIIKGYGKQASGGYSITINDFYQAGDELVFDTDLFGPKKDETVSETPSYPYIVIKTEYLENPVVFR